MVGFSKVIGRQCLQFLNQCTRFIKLTRASIWARTAVDLGPIWDRSGIDTGSIWRTPTMFSNDTSTMKLYLACSEAGLRTTAFSTNYDTSTMNYYLALPTTPLSTQVRSFIFVSLTHTRFFFYTPLITHTPMFSARIQR